MQTARTTASSTKVRTTEVQDNSTNSGLSPNGVSFYSSGRDFTANYGQRMFSA